MGRSSATRMGRPKPEAETWNCQRRLTFGNSLLASPHVNSHAKHDLDDEVRRLLDVHRGDWPAVADASRVSYSWISKFARGKIANPGYATLKRLCMHLKRRPPPQLPAVPAPAKRPTRKALNQGEGWLAGEAPSPADTLIS